MDSIMDNTRLLHIKEKLLKLKELDKEYKIFGSKKHQYKMNEKKRLKDLEEFEILHQITVPEEYKIFLTEIGNGGAGPYYGLFSFEDGINIAKDDYYAPKLDIPFAHEFPFNNEVTKNFIDHYRECLEEGEYNKIKRLITPDILTGVLFLSDYGCGEEFILVVKGEQQGKVWFEGGNLISCLKRDNRTQMSFFDWYEDWLDRSLAELDSLHYPLSFERNITILNCNKKELKEIAKKIEEYKDVKNLTLSEDNLSVFPKEVFQFKKLHVLFLPQNFILNIPEEISDLKDLKKLKLDFTSQVTLPHSLDQLEHLEEISISNNKSIEEIPEIIGMVTSLKRLNFSSCEKLKKIPENIGNLKNLENLNLSNCHSLKILPASIQSLENLETLEIIIDNLDLEDTLQKIKKLPKLRTLKLSYQLTYSQSLGELKNLKNLEIYQNDTLFYQGYKHVPIPEQVALIPYLGSLKISGYQVQSLPINIGKMQELKVLNIKGTSIKEFPHSLQKLTHLEKIKARLKTNQNPGILASEKEKVIQWFPRAKILISEF